MTIHQIYRDHIGHLILFIEKFGMRLVVLVKNLTQEMDLILIYV
jgi:hypothetical protein